MKKRLMMLVPVIVFFLSAGYFPAVHAMAQEAEAALSLSVDPAEEEKDTVTPETPKAPPISEAIGSSLSSEIYKHLSPESQEQLVEESNQVYEYCNKRQLFSSFHECQCVAAKFFDARLLNPDPEMNIINMGDRAAKDCPNIPGVAGYALNECMGAYGFRLKAGLEEFCECYAKTYADIYADDPRATLPHMSSIGSRAILACDATGIPSPLNPDR